MNHSKKRVLNTISVGSNFMAMLPDSVEL